MSSDNTIHDCFESIKKNNLPLHHWVLVLGQKSAGKTTLLQYSTLGLKEHKTSLFNFWSTDTAVFIDPSDDLDPKKFTNMLKYIKKNCHCILFTIDVPSLLNEEHFSMLVSTFSEQLILLKNTLKKVKIFFAIHKCDRILGFQEFFSYLTPTERDDMLGCHPDKLNTLLLTLNSQIIKRLSQEPLPQKRSLLTVFPAQFEKVTQALHQLIEKLPLCKTTQLKGCYFTSARQKHEPIDFLNHQKYPAHGSIAHKAYFIKSVLELIVLESQYYVHDSKKRDIKRWITLPLCLIILFFLTFAWHVLYQQNYETLEKIKIELNANEKPSQTDLPSLTQLNLLSNSIAQLNSGSLKYAYLLGLGQTHGLSNRLSLVYNTRLQTIFLPYIEGLLTASMTPNTVQDNLELYNALKIYLMLTEQQHVNQYAIHHWFLDYWAQKYPQNVELQHQLDMHLTALINLNIPNWPSDHNLIRDAQDTLLVLPKANIAFLELEAMYKNQQQPLLSAILMSSVLSLKIG